MVFLRIKDTYNKVHATGKKSTSEICETFESMSTFSSVSQVRHILIHNLTIMNFTCKCV